METGAVNNRRARKLAPQAASRRRAGGPIRVAIVDDYPAVRYGVRAILGEDPQIQVVADVESYEHLRRSDVEFDVVVLDLYIGDPGSDGVADFQAVAALAPHHPVLVYSTSTRDDDVYDVMHRHPVAGYLDKASGPQALRDAVLAVAAGEQVLPQQYAAAVQREVRRRQALEDLPPLTAREEQVLGLVALGLSDRQISSHLGVAEATAADHLKRIRVKLGHFAGNRVQLAHMAVVLGLVAPAPPRRPLLRRRS